MIKTIVGKNQIKRLYQLRNKIKKLQESEKKLSDDVLTHLIIHGVLKEGDWSAQVDVSKTRRPKWKEEFVNACGIEMAETIIENTEPTVSEKIVIYRKGFKI